MQRVSDEDKFVHLGCSRLMALTTVSSQLVNVWSERVRVALFMSPWQQHDLPMTLHWLIPDSILIMEFSRWKKVVKHQRPKSLKAPTLMVKSLKREKKLDHAIHTRKHWWRCLEVSKSDEMCSWSPCYEPSRGSWGWSTLNTTMGCLRYRKEELIPSSKMCRRWLKICLKVRPGQNCSLMKKIRWRPYASSATCYLHRWLVESR